jgi:sugar phosphate isomerase/epimerase
MTVSGMHVPLDRMSKDLDQALDEAQLYNTTNIICPWLPPDLRNAEGYARTAQMLNEHGQRCHNRGMVLSYHNHSFEFEKFGQTKGMDILFNNTDPFLVRAELDVYWLKHGGEDPVAFINRMGDRVQLLHLKDMAPGPDRRFAEVGSGILDFKSILAAANKVGVQWGAVEQDDCYGQSTLDAVKTSLRYLETINV